MAPLRNLATASLWAFEHALLDADVMQLQQALQDEFYNFATTPPGWQDAWKATAVVTACEAWRASANQQAKYGMGSRKYMAFNRWKRARKGLLHGKQRDSAGNPESTGCFGTI